MVNIAANEIVIKGQSEVIESWEVWFQTPFGLYATIQEAKDRVQSSDLDPDLVCVPVPVARSRNLYEVVTR